MFRSRLYRWLILVGMVVALSGCRETQKVSQEETPPAVTAPSPTQPPPVSISIPPPVEPALTPQQAQEEAQLQRQIDAMIEARERDLAENQREVAEEQRRAYAKAGHMAADHEIAIAPISYPAPLAASPIARFRWITPPAGSAPAQAGPPELQSPQTWQSSVIPSQAFGATVYITDTGEKYHRAGCQYLRKSSHPISLSEAKAEGYTPCSKCDPPQ